MPNNAYPRESTLSGGSSRPASALRDKVSEAVKHLLGVDPQRESPEALRAALERAFTSEQTDGYTEWKWTRPGSGPVRTDSAVTLTGARAVLYNAVKAGLPAVLQALKDLKPLKPASDPEELAAITAVMSALLQQLEEEVGGETLDVPRVEFRVERLEEHRDKLRTDFGFDDPDLIDVPSDDEEYTRWLQINAYVVSLGPAIKAVQSTSISLREQIRRVGSALDAVLMSVDEVCDRLERAGMSPAEQQLFELESTTIGDLLDWVRGWAERDARTILSSGGRYGVRAVGSEADVLATRVNHAEEKLPSFGDDDDDESIQDAWRGLTKSLLRVKTEAADGDQGSAAEPQREKPRPATGPPGDRKVPQRSASGEKREGTLP